MYGKKQKKVSEYGLNQSLLSYERELPPLMTSLGYSHDVISGETLIIIR